MKSKLEQMTVKEIRDEARKFFNESASVPDDVVLPCKERNIGRLPKRVLVPLLKSLGAEEGMQITDDGKYNYRVMENFKNSPIEEVLQYVLGELKKAIPIDELADSIFYYFLHVKGYTRDTCISKVSRFRSELKTYLGKVGGVGDLSIMLNKLARPMMMERNRDYNERKNEIITNRPEVDGKYYMTFLKRMIDVLLMDEVDSGKVDPTLLTIVITLACGRRLSEVLYSGTFRKLSDDEIIEGELKNVKLLSKYWDIDKLVVFKGQLKLKESKDRNKETEFVIPLLIESSTFLHLVDVLNNTLDSKQRPWRCGSVEEVSKLRSKALSRAMKREFPEKDLTVHGLRHLYAGIVLASRENKSCNESDFRSIILGHSSGNHAPERLYDSVNVIM